jgi:hypothetical protein
LCFMANIINVGGGCSLDIVSFTRGVCVCVCVGGGGREGAF